MSDTRLDINRSEIWQCTKRAFKRSSYSAAYRMDVKFVDDVGLSEGAVDQGGPRREYLQLLTDVVCHNTSLFCGSHNARHLTMFQGGQHFMQNL